VDHLEIGKKQEEKEKNRVLERYSSTSRKGSALGKEGLKKKLKWQRERIRNSWGEVGVASQLRGNPLDHGAIHRGTSQGGAAVRA